jgi:hypothetical protein
MFSSLNPLKSCKNLFSIDYFLLYPLKHFFMGNPNEFVSFQIFKHLFENISFIYFLQTLIPMLYCSDTLMIFHKSVYYFILAQQK